MFCYEGVPSIRNDGDCSGRPGMLSLLVSHESCMASVWKRSNSKYLTACFRDHTGRQRRITTKETNRKKAQKLADEYEKVSRTKRSLKKAQAVLDRLREELYGERVVRISLHKYTGIVPRKSLPYLGRIAKDVMNTLVKLQRQFMRV